VQADRYYVKLQKRTFLLVDLFDHSLFGQLFSNEAMKFQFTGDQTLTTFAYEVSTTTKAKIKKHHFIHIS